MVENSRPTVGVLAMQGDFQAHARALAAAGADAREVRTLADLEAVDGLIIPGGESTTIGMLLERYGLMEPLRQRLQQGMPTFGTCAGLILLAREIEGRDQPHLAALDVQVRRNAYGRQLDSFEADVPAPELGEGPLHTIFIRAPQITSAGPQVEILAETETGPILVRQGHILGAAFHPELTADTRVHRYFVRMIAP